MEGLQLRYRYENYNSLLSTTDIDFASSGNLKGSQFDFEVGNIVFEVDQSLSDVGFDFIGCSGWRIGGTEDLVVNGHFGRGKREVLCKHGSVSSELK